MYLGLNSKPNYLYGEHTIGSSVESSIVKSTAQRFLYGWQITRDRNLYHMTVTFGRSKIISRGYGFNP